MKKLSLVFLFICVLFQSNLNSQKRIMVQAIDIIEGKKKFKLFPSISTIHNEMKAIPPYCINFFANNKNFIIIDRQNLSLINAEKELQKTEEFIDGYIVEQGKSEGADYVLKGIYIESEKVLTFKIYNVADGSVLCSKEDNYRSMNQDWVNSLLHDMLFDCFNITYTVVRPIESKSNEVKSLLVAIGKKNKIKSGMHIDINTYITENIDGTEIKRKEKIGEGVIQEVQDENFSQIKITKGNKLIFDYLKDNKKLFCLLKNYYQ